MVTGLVRRQVGSRGGQGRCPGPGGVDKVQGEGPGCFKVLGSI